MAPLCAPCCRGGSAVCCAGSGSAVRAHHRTAWSQRETRIRQATSSRALTPAVARSSNGTDVLRCHCCIRRAWCAYGAPRCRGGSAVCSAGGSGSAVRAPNHRTAWSQRDDADPPGDVVCALTPAVARSSNDTDVLRCHCCIRRAWRAVMAHRVAAADQQCAARGKAAARSRAQPPHCLEPTRGRGSARRRRLRVDSSSGTFAQPYGRRTPSQLSLLQ